MGIVGLFNGKGLNKSEFRQLFQDKFEALKLFVYYKCGDEGLASDIAQDVFLKIWEDRETICKSTVVPLLYTMANNLFISEYRRNKLAFQLQLRNKSTGHIGFTAEETLVYHETKKRYEQTLARMPDDVREVFLMSRIEDLKYREIAVRLQISIKTVEKRMNKALALLRQELKPAF